MSTSSEHSTNSSLQSEGADFLATHPSGALFWDMGAGKTFATLMALDRVRAKNILIVGTRYIVEEVWPREIRKWGFSFDFGVCTRNVQRRHAAFKKPVVLVNYENLWWLLNVTDRTFDVVVFDELSKMKAPGTRRWRKFINSRRRFKRFWGLTGTPVGEHLMNLYGEMKALNAPLWRTKARYEREYFESYTIPGVPKTLWRPQEDALERLERAKQKP